MKADYINELENIEKVSKLILPLLYFAFLLAVLMSGWLCYQMFSTPTTDGFSYLFEHNKFIFPLNITTQTISLMTYFDKLFIVIYMVAACYSTYIFVKLVENTKQHKVFHKENIKIVKIWGGIYLAYFITQVLSSIINIVNEQNIHIAPSSIISELLILSLIWILHHILKIGETLTNNDEMTI